jgi:hypothetical protein
MRNEWCAVHSLRFRGLCCPIPAPRMSPPKPEHLGQFVRFVGRRRTQESLSGHSRYVMPRSNNNMLRLHMRLVSIVYERQNCNTELFDCVLPQSCQAFEASKSV